MRPYDAGDFQPQSVATEDLIKEGSGEAFNLDLYVKILPTGPAPGVPESLTAGSISSSDLTFSWSPPSYVGGSPLTWYYVYWD